MTFETLMSVYRWFENGKYERVKTHVPIAEAMDAMCDLMLDPRSTKLMMTDAADRCVSEVDLIAERAQWAKDGQDWKECPGDEHPMTCECAECIGFPSNMAHGDD